MSLKQKKFIKFSDQRDATHNQFTNAISNLVDIIDEAMLQQAYILSDPDTNNVQELLPKVGAQFDAASLAFDAEKDKLVDMQLVATQQMTVADLITKYSLDLAAYSDRLG